MLISCSAIPSAASRSPEHARLLGEQLSDASLLAVALCHFGQLHYVRGDHAAAVSAMATCMDRLGAEVVPRRSGVVQTYSVVAECFVAMAEASRGRFNDALAAADRCVTIAGENRFYGALAGWARGVVHLTRGDVKPARTMLEAASADCDAVDIPFHPSRDRRRSRPRPGPGGPW